MAAETPSRTAGGLATDSVGCDGAPAHSAIRRVSLPRPGHASMVASMGTELAQEQSMASSSCSSATVRRGRRAASHAPASVENVTHDGFEQANSSHVTHGSGRDTPA